MKAIKSGDTKVLIVIAYIIVCCAFEAAKNVYIIEAGTSAHFENAKMMKNI